MLLTAGLAVGYLVQTQRDAGRGGRWLRAEVDVVEAMAAALIARLMGSNPPETVENAAESGPRASSGHDVRPRRWLRAELPLYSSVAPSSAVKASTAFMVATDDP